ncbi:MAG: GTP-binding protein [Flavobacteriaceae bacterium]|nr:GTP-binding protein [Bacteroidia bacterium]MBT8268261.1 GTP-binding protein [Bacteroidia bacterium]NNF75979.1 GTP-binding protein [Flavobacteriaceae bacterium]NNK70850.1 GTP-binding protein [Flavobacteriaceae bacterium]NNL81101.1 GTP-binding protein [Flavobacteriaceae bacterium]
MSLPNEIVLRPRFRMEFDSPNEDILALFEEAKSNQSDFIVSRVDDHVFVKIPSDRQHFWSPQLHLEIFEVEKGKTKLHGLFGPNPTIWTMFMFLHFIVAGMFIGFGIWAYVNWTLDKDFAIQLFLTLMMTVMWFVLYFSGRLGRAAGKDEMHQLHWFMIDILDKIPK